MIKIMFVCHGNICRSPMAEFIFKAMLAEKGITLQFDDTVTEMIFNKSNSDLYGARNINSLVARLVETQISDMILNEKLNSGVNAVAIYSENGMEIKVLQTI